MDEQLEGEASVTLRLLTVQDVASYLRLSVRTVERLISEGEIRAFWIGGSRRFEEADLQDFVAKCREKHSVIGLRSCEE